MKICLLTILIPVFAMSGFSQKPVFRKILASDGLGGNTVYYVFQDKQKYIWIATDRGVTRFDGFEYQTYTKLDGLSDNEVFQIHEDSRGRVWFLTSNGKPSYYQNGGIYNPSTVPALAQIDPGCYLYGFCEDSDGNVWFGSKCKGVYSLSVNGKVSHFEANSIDKRAFLIGEVHGRIVSAGWFGLYRADSETGRLIPLDTTRRLMEYPRSVAHGGRYYVTNATSLLCFDLAGKMIWEDKLFDQAEIIHVSVWSEEKLLLGTRKGYCLFDPSTRKKTRAYLEEQAVSSVMRDHQGGIWVSTLDNGVFYSVSHDIQKISKEDGLPGKQVVGIYRRENGIALAFDHATLATIDSAGIVTRRFPYSRHRDRLTFIKDTVFVDSVARGTWIGLESSLVKIGPKNDTSFYQISPRDILVENDGLYIASSFGLLWLSWDELERHHYVPGNEWLISLDLMRQHIILEEDCRVLHKDREGKIWIGKENGISVKRGVGFFEIRGKVKTMDIASAFGGVWVSTAGNGLYFFSETDTMNVFGRNSEALFCTKLIPDRDPVSGKEMLWGASNQGLVKIYKDQGEIHTRLVGAGAGQPFTEVNDVVRDKDGVLWIATRDGLVRVPAEIQSRRSPTPEVLIDRLEVSGSIRPLSTTLRLDHHENDLRVQIRSPFYRSRPHFQYKIDQGNWRDLGGSELKLEGLAPGSHEIEIRALARDGTASETPVRLTVSIAPPFWATWWFRSGIGVLVVAVVVLFFRIRVLTYNRDVVREILEALAQRLRRTKPDPEIILKVVDGSHVVLKEQDVLWVKAANVYVEVMTPQKCYTVRAKLKEMEELMGDFKNIKRVHRSYLVNTSRIEGVNAEKTRVLFAEGEVPLSKTYRNLFKDFKGRSRLKS